MAPGRTVFFRMDDRHEPNGPPNGPPGGFDPQPTKCVNFQPGRVDGFPLGVKSQGLVTFVSAISNN